MVELRGTRSSSRIKAEPALKRRFSDALEADAAATTTKATKAAKTAKSTTKNAPPPKREPTPEPEPPPVLPNKLTDSTPLPVLPAPQPDDLDEKDWQPLNDSGIFAASLARSRLAIAKGALFEKFWTKPTATKKQKDMTEEEKLQLKAAKGPTQSKVGLVKMVCEPLTFEVQLLMIKDQHQGHRQGQLPPDKQHLIYGTPHRPPAPAYTPPYRPPVQQQPLYTPSRPPAPITPNPGPPRPQAVAPPPPRPTPTQPQPTQSRPPSTASTPASKPASTPSRASGSGTNAQAPDPVIHALAQRASANPELKAVMKIVATGLASQQQLQYFQKHIDELTELVRQRQEQEARSRAPAVAPSPAPKPAATPQPKPAASIPAASAPAASTPTQATPTQSTPAQSRPVQASPAQTTPAQPTPAQSTPAQSRPSSSTPVSSTTASSAPALPRPTQATPAPSTPALSTQAPPQPVHRPAPAPTPAPIPAPSPAPMQRQAQMMPNPSPSHSIRPANTPVHAPRPPPSHAQQHHPVQQYHYQPTPPPAPRPKMVTTATPLHILIQFGENPHERFLFPKHSILEFNATLTEVIVSFVVVKKGKYKGNHDTGAQKGEEKEYWTPVTLTFKGDAPTLSVLGRVAEPYEVARRAMEDVMVRCERAEEGFLAFRLPREPMVMDLS